MPQIDVSVHVDANGNVTIPAGADITVSQRNTNIKFSFDATTDRAWRFSQFLVSAQSFSCPPTAPYPPAPPNNEFTISGGTGNNNLTVVDKCSSTASYNYALQVTNPQTNVSGWFDPRIVNQPGGGGLGEPAPEETQSS